MASIESKAVQRGIAKAVEDLGFRGVARDIRKANTKEQIKKNVNFLINIQNKSMCSTYLTDPVTRKRTKNPMRPKCLEFNKKLKKALNYL